MVILFGVGTILLIVSIVLYIMQKGNEMALFSLVLGIISLVLGAMPYIKNLQSVPTITSIQIDKESIVLNVGESMTLRAVVEPKEASVDVLSWKTSDSSIVTVDENGYIKAIAKGNAIITVNAGEFSASCDVTVKNPITGIQFEESSIELNVGESQVIRVVIEPEDADIQTIFWKSSDTNIVTVDENGFIKALDKGDAIITVEAGEYSASCKVMVNKNESSELNITDENMLAFVPKRMYIPLGYMLLTS